MKLAFSILFFLGITSLVGVAATVTKDLAVTITTHATFVFNNSVLDGVDKL